MNRISSTLAQGLLAATFAAVVLSGAAGAGVASAASGGPGPVAIGIAVPASVQLGQVARLDAKVVSASGAPLANLKVTFTSPASFLNTSGEVVIATATTNAAGIAEGQFQARRSGTLTINAAFAGDSQHAAARTSASLPVTGDGQLYVQSAGVKLPGLNATSTGATTSSPRWAFSGWPIAAVLLIVWSLYGTAVFFMSRIAGASDLPQEASK